ncbi:MAG: preprotein translocase subunit SecE [Chloroflexota bacterium]|jgi:preprotein translocase subunit SecE|tara:strand:- start:2540 stop:2821 length:282 start_codon:yes stop_codon:yes gene_type:complete
MSGAHTSQGSEVVELLARGQNAARKATTDATKKAFSFRVFGEVYSELRRVTWPTREETTRLTIMVVAVSAVIGIFLGLVDMGFSRLVGVFIGN